MRGQLETHAQHRSIPARGLALQDIAGGDASQPTLGSPTFSHHEDSSPTGLPLTVIGLSIRSTLPYSQETHAAAHLYAAPKDNQEQMHVMTAHISVIRMPLPALRRLQSGASDAE